MLTQLCCINSLAATAKMERLQNPLQVPQSKEDSSDTLLVPFVVQQLMNIVKKKIKKIYELIKT